MKYRYVVSPYRNDNDELFPLKIQRKGWFFWHDTNLYAKDAESARKFINSLEDYYDANQ